MKILQIIPELNVGGTETGTIDLAEFLVQEGYEAFVISHGGQLVEKLNRVGANHTKLPVHKKSPLSIWWTTQKVINFIEENNIDLIHARSRVPGWIGYLITRQKRIPWITTCHGYYTPHFGSRVMGWADKVIVASSSVYSHMKNNFHVPEDKLIIIPRGIHVEHFPFSPKEFNKNELILGTMGRITPIKGHHVFIEIVEKVKNLLPHIHVLGFIYGNVPEKHRNYFESLKKMISQKGLEKNVFLMPAVPSPHKALKEMHVFLFPTIHPEGFGRVILEAQATGVPVIASKLGGTLDIIDEKVNGFLIEPLNIDHYAQRVCELTQDIDFRNKLILNARQKVEEKFSHIKMCQKTLSLYKEKLQHINPTN